MRPKEEQSERILSRFTSLSEKEQLDLLQKLIVHTKASHHLNDRDILGKEGIEVPFGIFGTPKISSLEAIVKYLKEIKALKFSKISRILNRNNKTIWATYAKASQKMPEPFTDIRDDLSMPISPIADRTLSVLEHVVHFAKHHDFTNHEVALMLHLDDRTIWTVWDRVKKKRGAA